MNWKKVAELLVSISESPELMLLLKATAAMCIGLVVFLAARSARASLRHLALRCTFALLAALPLTAVFFPAVRFEVPIQTVSSANAAGQTAHSVQPTEAIKISPQTVLPAHFSFSRILLWIWVLGLFVFSFAFVRSLWKLSALRRSAIPWQKSRHQLTELAFARGLQRSPDVLLHEGVNVPLTMGVVRHAILLPSKAESWEIDDLRRVFVHELEHVKRRDWPIHCAARALCSIYWFHPLVWIIWRRMCLEAERTCDDAVLTQSDRTDYAEQLLRLARNLSTALTPPALSMANRSDLSLRVRAILDADQSRGRAGLTITSLAVCVVLALTVLIAPMTAVRRTVLAASTEQESSSRNITNHALDRAIIEAAAKGNEENVAKLLDAGADVNSTVPGDGSPLIVAAREDRQAIVALLLGRGADPNVGVAGDGNPLIAAARAGHLDIVQLLLNRGADVNRVVTGDEDALIQASASGDLDVVRLLVSRGADVNMRVPSGNTDGEVRSALSMARQNHRDAVVQYLLSIGAHD